MHCQHCGQILKYRNPVPTVDIIISYRGGIVLIERKNPPHGWALPGGFVDYGETLEQAAVREAKEETALELSNLRQFHAYSDPARDSRLHTITTIYSAEGHGNLQAGDDAALAKIFRPDGLPALAFDHGQILSDYFAQHPLINKK
ncbi:MAG: NUDIX hydrolase [Thermodesulfobacteriota bacterium]